MKKFFKFTLYSIILLLGAKFMVVLITHSIFMAHYRSENYDSNDLNANKFLNIQEPYILHYNLGNISYNTKDYLTAVNEYNSALGLFPPKSRVCDIRVNLSLSYLALVDYKLEDKKDIANLKSSLTKILEVLRADNCANATDTGESEDAEQLEKDIEDYLKALEDAESGGGQGEEPPEENEDPDSGSDSREDELNNRTDEANDEQNENQQTYEWIDDHDYYHGIRW